MNEVYQWMLARTKFHQQAREKYSRAVVVSFVGAQALQLLLLLVCTHSLLPLLCHCPVPFGEVPLLPPHLPSSSPSEMCRFGLQAGPHRCGLCFVGKHFSLRK